VSVVAFAAPLVVVCCSFPSYQADLPDDDTGIDDDGGLDGDASVDTIVPPIDTGPIVVCGDSGLKSGQATACACGDAGAIDAAPSEGGDGGDSGIVGGYKPCMLSGSLGDCLGCATDPGNSCEGATLPQYTTCVPGGVVSLGVANKSVCSPSGCPLEEPEHPVALSRYFMDDHEVTVSRFRQWWGAGHVTPKSGDLVFVAGDGTKISWQAAWTVSEPTLADPAKAPDNTWMGASVATNDALAINGVDFPTALAYCMAFGRRLPTEAEWEAEAAGRTDGRLFPWSGAGSKTTAPAPSMIPCDHATSGASGSSCGTPVKALAPTTSGFSVDGAYDLAGNVAEWVLDVAPTGSAGCTSDCYPSTPIADPVHWFDAITVHGVRGGSYADAVPAKLRAQARDFADAPTKSPKIGFRCVKR
jgi:formylglycine-generating enzyme required for sulfatase activity